MRNDSQPNLFDSLDLLDNKENREEYVAELLGNGTMMSRKDAYLRDTLEVQDSMAQDAHMLDTLALDASIQDTQPSIASIPKSGDSSGDAILTIDLKKTSGVPDLHPEVLDVLGADPSKPVNTEIELQDDLTARWKFWLLSQLAKDEMDTLMSQYPRGSDKCLFEAPKLNPEIAAMSTEVLTKGDNKFIASQNLTGSALVALGTAISNLLVNEEIDKLELLRKLCDAGKMMTSASGLFFHQKDLCISQPQQTGP